MRHREARGRRGRAQVQQPAGQAVHLQELGHVARRRTRVFNWSAFFFSINNFCFFLEFFKEN